MIITLFCVLLLIVGIVCFVIDDHIYTHGMGWFNTGLMAIIFGVAGTIVCSLVVLCNQAGADVEYQNKLYERQVLEYRIEHQGDDVVGNEMLYKEVVEFNNDLRSVKKWANNPFTNWFNVKEISGIEYIEIGEVEND